MRESLPDAAKVAIVLLLLCVGAVLGLLILPGILGLIIGGVLGEEGGRRLMWGKVHNPAGRWGRRQ